MNGFEAAPLRARAALLLPVLLLGGCDILGEFEEEDYWMSVTPSRITVVEGRVVDVVVRSNIGLDVWDMGWGSVDQSVALVDTVDVIGDSAQSRTYTALVRAARRSVSASTPPESTHRLLSRSP